MARSFDIGRESEVLYNQELYRIFEALKNMATPKPDLNADPPILPIDPIIGPSNPTEGALWFTGQELKYFQSGAWKLLFGDKFKMISDICSPTTPEAPIIGQLWLNGGILTYYDGTDWKPVKAVNAEAELDLSVFEQFLIISPLLVSGNLVSDYSSYIGSYTIWAQSTHYKIGDQVYYNSSYYRCISEHDSDVLFDVSKWELVIQLWLPGTVYSVGDSVSYDNVYYECKTDHTSEATFDPINWNMISPIIKSQFLLPSADMDRFFISGSYTDNYDKLTNTAIQYPSSELQGKVASAIHVNPGKLTNVTKRLVMINKTNPIVMVPESNTEYYGFKDGLGRLLIKANGPLTSYTSIAGGIKLSESTANTVDFVLAVTYEFSQVKQSGLLQKGKVVLSDTSSIYVGQLIDPMCVFVQGMYLDDNLSNYEYDYASGYLKLPSIKKMDVDVITFPMKETGDITDATDPRGGMVHVVNTYTKPLVFVYGETMNYSIADYVIDSIDPSIIYIKNAEAMMRYAIVETEGTEIRDKMFVKAGIVPAAGSGGIVSIPCTDDDSIDPSSGDTILAEIPAGIKPILFVDGILVSQRDLKRNSDGSITAYGLTTGQDYVLLKDPGDRLIFDDLVNFITIPTPHADDALVYIEDSLICDNSAIYISKLPTSGVDGQIKQLVTSTGSAWYVFNGITKLWDMMPRVSHPEDTALITQLDSTSQGYAVSSKSVSILQNFGTKDCSYYAYTFANSVEQPLQYGNIITNDVDIEYNVGYKTPYEPNTNELAVWMDGIRQYYITEVSSRTFKIPEAVRSNLFYVVEKPERSESISCQRQILTHLNISMFSCS
jgi:hypothetical protein